MPPSLSYMRLSKAHAYLCCAAVTCGCAAPLHRAGRPQPADGLRPEALRPIADHHVHLLSPGGVSLNNPAPLPVVQLPEELARLLKARNELAKDQSALSRLYTPDATYFIGGNRGFARGRDAVAGHVKWTIYDDPYRIVPVSFAVQGSFAQVNGYVMWGPQFEWRFGFSELVLSRDSGGDWLIASETFIFEEPPTPPTPVTAADKIKELDQVGTKVAAVLSDAYYYDAVRPEPVTDPYEKVRAENDWTADQTAAYPNRLFAFCSFNPLSTYALAELDRCAATKRFTGLKLNFNAAQVYLRDADQVRKVRAVFERANQHRLPIIIHLRTALVPNQPEKNYGAADAEIFLHQLVAAAPDIVIQVAHLWGGESYTPSALKVFADAVTSHDPVTKNLYFDVSGLAHYAREEDMAEIVREMRRIGFERILWGSDAPPTEAWQLFRTKVPLTKQEFGAIAANIAPYLQGK